MHHNILFSVVYEASQAPQVNSQNICYTGLGVLCTMLVDRCNIVCWNPCSYGKDTVSLCVCAFVWVREGYVFSQFAFDKHIHVDCAARIHLETSHEQRCMVNSRYFDSYYLIFTYLSPPLYTMYIAAKLLMLNYLVKFSNDTALLTQGHKQDRGNALSYFLEKFLLI